MLVAGTSPPPTSDKTAWRSEKIDDVELPAAHQSSHEYCPWGYFGNEGSEIDLYTSAALHIEIPPFGQGLRVATEPLKRKPAKGEWSRRKRNTKPD
jgi:hypothetical protein